MSEIVGVDPKYLKEMIDSLDRNATALQLASSRLQTSFVHAELTDPRVQEIRNIGQWAQDQLAHLKRRYDLARALQDPGRPDTMVQYPERAASDAEVPLIPPPPPEPDGKRDAKKVADWWKGLTPEQRIAWLDRNPKLIGGLAGVPTWTRDYANRRALEGTIQILEAEKKALEARIADLSRLGDPRVLGSLIAQLQSQLDSVQQRLGGCHGLKESLIKVAQNPRNYLDPSEVYLLDFDPHFANGDGRAIVALGDPSTAKDVGVIVPGMTNTLSDVPQRIDDAAGLRAELGPGLAKSTSTIMWLGYDTPDDIGIVSQGQAEAGAKELRQFVKDLRDTNDGAHIAVFGHSYGSMVTGLAAKDGLAADDVVLYGSPGVGFYLAEHLKLRQGYKNHVWVARTPDDTTATSGLFFFPYRIDPMRDIFGARRVRLDLGQLQYGHDHSEYLERGTEGLKNFARILTGNYNEVRSPMPHASVPVRPPPPPTPQPTRPLPTTPAPPGPAPMPPPTPR